MRGLSGSTSTGTSATTSSVDSSPYAGAESLSATEELVSQYASFLPAILLWHYAQAGSDADSQLVTVAAPQLKRSRAFAPSSLQFESAVLFVDVSGFTNLSTRLDVDALQRHINRYFTRLLDVVHAHGGDVLRFMGDAMLVTWALPLPPPAQESKFPEDGSQPAEQKGAGTTAAKLGDEPPNPAPLSPRSRKREAQLKRHQALLRAAVRAACACALELEEKCGEYEIAELPGTNLSLHAGLGVGRLTAFSVGSRRHAEFLVSGDPIRQIGLAESCAGRRETVLSQEAWALLKPDSARSADGGDVAEGAASVRGEPVGGNGCVRLLEIGPLETYTSPTTSPAVNLAESLLTSELLSLQSTQRAHRRVPVEAEASLRAHVHPVAADAIAARMLGQVRLETDT